MLRIFMTAAAGALVSSAALGADDLYYTPGPTLAPEASYMPDWSGWYAGFNGGGAWGETDTNTSVSGPASFDFDGGQVGVQLGKNWQNGMIVLGVGTDINYFSSDGSGGVPSQTVDTDFLMSVTGRAGLAYGNIQPYVLGGLSVLDYDYSITSAGGVETHGDTDLGATLGAGVEVAVSSDVSLFGEYRHYWFDGEALSFAGPAPAPAQLVSPELNVNTVSGGINWRF